MEIKFEKIDKVNGLVTMTLKEEDYKESVEKGLKNLRKKASIPGFRPGQVPMSLVKKRFGLEVKAEEVNKLLGAELFKYIREQKINVLGEPMPSEDKQPKIDFENQTEYTFVFDVALAPEMDGKISDKDEIPYYEVKVNGQLQQGGGLSGQGHGEGYPHRIGRCNSQRGRLGNQGRSDAARLLQE